MVTISFSSKTTNAIYMDIFDIRGRKLKTYNIENTGSITNEIDLSSYDSGVYLIHIKDGPNQSTKKVIKK